MQMRRYFLLIAFLLTILAMPTAEASYDGSPSIAGGRPIVAIYPVVNSMRERGSYYLVDMVNESLFRKFDSSTYLVMTGPALTESLQRYGVYDDPVSDTAAIRAALRAMGVHYIVKVELLPASAKQKISFPNVFLLRKTWVATVPLACLVIDVPTGTVVYDAILAEQGSDENFIGFASKGQALRGSLGKTLERFERETLIPE